MNADDFFGLHVWQHEQQQQQQARERKQRVYKPRLDPRQTMGDSEFKRHFRFSKESVGRITDLLEEDLVFESNRGLPVPPVQQVCIALNSFAQKCFLTVTGGTVGKIFKQETGHDMTAKQLRTLLQRMRTKQVS